MARCARTECGTWRPDLLVRYSGLGAALDGQWFCSRACLEADARVRLDKPARLSLPSLSMPPLRIGVLLVHQGVITALQLRDALAAQKLSGLRLGAQLRAMGIAEARDVLRGLAAQAGVGYLTSVDPESVREAPGRLSQDAVRALSLVPIESDAELKRLRVACVAPVPRTALGALSELTGWSIEPLLVSDEHFEPLVTAYGRDARGVEQRVEARTVAGIGDAAALVATAAAGRPGVKMAQARFDPYMWVRLESESRVEDVLVAMDRLHGEDACQAAPTLP
ncbi:MAG: hypothetical protein Q8L86_03745 [Vicinamibacterales bacterium]|nr:hypothetical protein [Vicinamibacterales bacterium]